MANSRTIVDLTDDELGILLEACGLDGSYITAMGRMADESAVFADILNNKIESLSKKPAKIRFIINTSEREKKEFKPDTGVSDHWAMIELSINESGKVDGIEWIDSLTITEHYKIQVAEYLDRIYAHLDNADLVTDDVNLQKATPHNQPDSNSCGYYALMNLINRTDHSMPTESDRSLRAQLKRAANKETSAQELRAICDPILKGPDLSNLDLPDYPDTGVTAPPPPAPPAAHFAKPNFQNVMIHYKGRSTQDQARQLLDAIKLQRKHHTHIGFTYSANSLQTDAIREYNNDPSPENYEAMKATFQGAANQGAVVRELFSMVDNITDEQEKLVLRNCIRILPITTIIRDSMGDHPTTNEQLKQDIDAIAAFSHKNKGCILGWQNEDSTDKEYAIGGRIAGANFTAPQRQYVQSELQKLRNDILISRQNQPRTSSQSTQLKRAPSSPPPGVPAQTSTLTDRTREKINREFGDIIKQYENADEKTLNKMLEQHFFSTLARVNDKGQESYSRALIASINQYAELRFSARADSTQLNTLKERINGLQKTLTINQAILAELKTNHLEKITDDNERKKYAAEIEKRMTLPSIATALSSVKKFNMAETLVDGWLQASIIEESVAIPCKTNEEAMSKVNEILGTATSQSSANPHLASTEGYSVDHSRSTLSVFEVPISVKNEILRTAAVRTVNTETQSVRVDLYSHEINYKKIKHLPNNDPELMAKVAQIVNLATTPLDSLARPLRLNPGRPPIMPKNMIEAYIIYCEFKGINLEPPEGYIQFQQSVKKPGWFGKDSLHDNFAKAWKISHPEDVGIKEQKELESTPAHPRPRSR